MGEQMWSVPNNLLYYRDDFARNMVASGFVSEKRAIANRQLVNNLDSAASICNTRQSN